MELLKQLTACAGPSGSEQAVRELIGANVVADEMHTDALGNLIAHRKGSGKRLMLTAPMDEPGFLVTCLEGNTARVGGIGQPEASSLKQQKVSFLGGGEGIVSLESGKEVGSATSLDDCYIDVLSMQNENLIGERAVFAPHFTVAEEIVCAKALGTRAACFALIRLLEQLEDMQYDLYAVWTAQSHLGFRGAQTAARFVRPDVALSVSACASDDIPGGKRTLSLGAGPVVRLKDKGFVCPPSVHRLVDDAAQQLGMLLQYDVRAQGNCEAGAIQTAGGATVAGSIMIPCRYANTPTELIHREDLQGTVKLLAQLVKKEML